MSKHNIRRHQRLSNYVKVFLKLEQAVLKIKLF